jgi:L-ascorbate metabolism protein UlaG (beta-lactamase superfamily)
MASTTIQFLGHASFKLTTPEGKIFLIDPWLTDNPFLPEMAQEQDRIDAILITHGHEDHLDSQILAIQKRTGCKIVANNIVRWWLMGKGADEHIFEGMNIGGSIPLFDTTISMTNALHISHINPRENEAVMPHPSVGFVVACSDGTRVYFAGDTGVFMDMKLIGEIYRPNIAVLPIGDRFTMGPLEASYAVRLLGVKHVIPFHYGTFKSLTGTPEALKELTHDIEELTIHALRAGNILDCSRCKN